MEGYGGVRCSVLSFQGTYFAQTIQCGIWYSHRYVRIGIIVDYANFALHLLIVATSCLSTTS